MSHSRRTRTLASKPHKVPASRPTVHKINNNVYAHDNRGATTASNSTQDRATTNNKASLCWGSPKGKKGTVRRGSPPRQPANPNVHVRPNCFLRYTGIRAQKYTSEKPNLWGNQGLCKLWHKIQIEPKIVKQFSKAYGQKSEVLNKWSTHVIKDEGAKHKSSSSALTTKVHITSTSHQQTRKSHNRRTRPTRTAQLPIHRPHFVGGAPRAKRGRSVEGHLRVNPQTSTYTFRPIWRYTGIRAQKYTSKGPSI